MTERLFAQESLRTSFFTHRSISKFRWHFTCPVECTLTCELCGCSWKHSGHHPTPIPTLHLVILIIPAHFFFLLKCMYVSMYLRCKTYVCKTSLVAQTVKHLPTMRETRVQSLGWEDLVEKGMATHSSTLAWRIPWTGKPGRLQSMGSQRVRHN